MKAGNLRQRANGKWQYRKSYGSHPDGRRRERTAVFAAKNQTEAERIARGLVAKWDAEFKAQATYRGTVAEVLDRDELLGERAEQTTYRYRSIRRRIRDRFGHLPVNELTAYDLDRWYTELLKNGVEREYTSKGRTLTRHLTLSPATVHHHHRVIHAILERAYKWDMVERNVADKATPPKTRKTDQKPFMPTEQALQVMVAACTNPNMRMGILLAAVTGCRAGEITGLRWDDLIDGVLYVSESTYKVPGKPVQRKGTKADKAKEVTLPEPMLVALAQHRAWQVESCAQAGMEAVWGPILANLRDDLTAGTGYSPKWLGKEWTRLRESTGVGPIKFHGLRHLHGSILMDNNISPAAAAERQGQALETFMRHYGHGIKGADLEAANVIGSQLSGLFTQAIAERNPQYASKLTDEQVVELHRLYETGDYSHRDLAARFGISRAYVSMLLSGQYRPLLAITQGESE